MMITLTPEATVKELPGDKRVTMATLGPRSLVELQQRLRCYSTLTRRI